MCPTVTCSYMRVNDHAKRMPAGTMDLHFASGSHLATIQYFKLLRIVEGLVIFLFWFSVFL